MSNLEQLRVLYRLLASALHPDRGRSDDDRHMRTQFMTRVNNMRHAQDLAGMQAMARELGIGPTPAPPPRPAPAAPPAPPPRAVDVNPWGIRRAVLTDDGWVTPNR